MAMTRTGTDLIPDRPYGGSLGPRALALAALPRWRSATVLALACAAGLVVAGYFAFPAEFSTTALVRFRFNDYLVADDARPGGGGREELENRQRTQVALVKSGRVLGAAAQSDPRVFPAAKLANDMRAGFSEGTPYMYLSLTGLEPERMALSLNAVAEAFLKEVVETDRRDLFDKSEQLNKAIADSSESIIKKKSDLRRLTNGQKDDPKSRVVEAEIQATWLELTRVQLDIEKKKATVGRARARLESLDESPIGLETIDEILEQETSVVAARATLARLEAAEADIRTRFSGPKEPPILQAAEATKRQKDVLQSLKAEFAAKAEVQLRRRLRSEIKAAIAADEEELASLSIVEKILVGRRDAGAGAVAAGLPPSIEMQFMAIEQDEEVLKTLRNRRERLRIELQSGGPRATIFQPAQVPILPNYRGQAIKAGAAGLAGLALGWLGVGYLEVRSRRVRDGRALAALTGLRILGAIPSGSPSGKELLQPQDLALSVAADLLRTNLQLDDRLRACRTLVVTSASANEGKSTLAMLLAGSLARAGFRTLLVDADFRNPSLSRRLGIDPCAGLSEMLTVDRGARTKIIEIKGLPLGLIPAGLIGLEAANRLARFNLRSWFRSALNRWEYIIIDSPPVLPVPDAAFLGKSADGIVLCARAGVSRSEQVDAAVEHMTGLGLRCLGIVLNDVRGGRPAYYGSSRVGSPTAVALDAPLEMPPSGS